MQFLNVLTFFVVSIVEGLRAIFFVPMFIVQLLLIGLQRFVVINAALCVWVLGDVIRITTPNAKYKLRWFHLSKDE